jgi:hypothetical protein
LSNAAARFDRGEAKGGGGGSAEGRGIQHGGEMQELSAPQAGSTRSQSQPCGDRRHPALTAVSWRPLGEMTFADWVEHGRRLGLMGRSAGWWIGDWLYYGNAEYGERYARAARVTGYDVQTLMNMVYVASHVAPSRRREKLSWSHHAEVVAMNPSEQDMWLDRAEADRLSVRCLREQIRRVTRAARQTEEQAALAGRGHPHPVPGIHDPEVVCPSCGHSFSPADEDQELVAVA